MSIKFYHRIFASCLPSPACAIVVPEIKRVKRNFSFRLESDDDHESEKNTL